MSLPCLCGCCHDSDGDNRDSDDGLPSPIR
jgi:hypothetical protein